MFGPHLTLDLTGCSRERLNDRELISKILDELPAKLGMHKISEPFVKKYDVPTPGLTAFVIISESHISIHTFVEERFASIDIFSCKDFDVKKATDYLTKVFQPEKIEKNFLMRGTHYPMEVRKAVQFANRERISRKV